MTRRAVFFVRFRAVRKLCDARLSVGLSGLPSAARRSRRCGDFFGGIRTESFGGESRVEKSARDKPQKEDHRYQTDSTDFILPFFVCHLCALQSQLL